MDETPKLHVTTVYEVRSSPWISCNRSERIDAGPGLSTCLLRLFACTLATVGSVLPLSFATPWNGEGWVVILHAAIPNAVVVVLASGGGGGGSSNGGGSGGSDGGGGGGGDTGMLVVVTV